MRPMRCSAIAATVLAAACLAAPAAQADSIAYVKGHDLWLAAPDGSGQYQVTTDGTAQLPYGSPSQADDGTIVARKGSEIVRLKQNGELLSRFDPPDTTDSAGQPIGGVPVDVAVSPDGATVAYSYYQYNCPPGASCGARYVTLYSSASAATPAATHGKLFRNSPSWVSNSRVLVFGGFLSQVNYDAPGGGDDDDVHWFDDKDIFDPSTDLGDGELSRQGDRLALVRGYGDSTHLMFLKVTQNVLSGAPSGPPAYACNTGEEPTLDGPSWSPDGSRIAFAHKDGIEVLPLPSVEPGCPGASSGTVVIPGGSQPDWGPAAVAPGPRTSPQPAVPGPAPGPAPTPAPSVRPAPAVRPAPGTGRGRTPPPTRAPVTAQQPTVASCKAIKNARKRGRCVTQVKRAKAIATCKRTTRGKARTRCVAKAKRRFA
ncbi:MAG TPA: hypothetical protein VLK58_25680 [Conexibacter sp.]|nr:hypothetical protein [Conexibacter sp.]